MPSSVFSFVFFFMKRKGSYTTVSNKSHNIDSFGLNYVDQIDKAASFDHS